MERRIIVDTKRKRKTECRGSGQQECVRSEASGEEQNNKRKCETCKPIQSGPRQQCYSKEQREVTDEGRNICRSAQRNRRKGG
jgi:hypothetical protein